MSGKLKELRDEGLKYEGFREGYKARDALIRMGEMLRNLRESAGFRQEELAAKIGMSQPAISRLESGFGPRGPEMETIMRFVHGCEAELVVGVKSMRVAEAADKNEHLLGETSFETRM
jgi:transcriptional regulator with XRE-family HTH domain